MSYSITACNRQAFLDLAKAGIPLIPVRLVKRKNKWEKVPCITGWPNRATTDLATIDYWTGRWPDVMPGIPTGPRSGFAVVDLDRKNGKDGFAAIRAMGFDPDILSSVIVESPGGSRHLYFRYEEGLRSTTDKIAPGVDTRAAGGYVLAPGATHAGGTYRLVSGSLKDDLTPWPVDLMPPSRPREPGQGEPTGLPFSVILDALKAIPNEARPYGEYIEFGMAIHAECDGSEVGLQAWQEWCAKNPNNDPDLNVEKWESFKANGGLTGWHIVAEAERYGWHDDTLIQLRHMKEMEDLDQCWTEEELRDLDVAGFVAAYVVQADDDALVVGPEEDAPAPLLTNLLSPDDCLATLSESPEWIIKGLIERGVTGAIYGDPNAGKTNFALYLAYKAAQGAPVFRRKVKKVPVLYLAFEAPRGMKRRVGALRREHGPADGFHIWVKPPNLKPDKKGRAPGMDQVILQAKAVGAGLVIIDTLAAGFAGIEENAVSAEGMSAAVQEMQRLANSADCAVIVLHHPRKGSDDMRGSGSLLGTIDMTLFVEKDDASKIIKASTRKTRDTAGGDVFAYRNHGVHVADDGDGDPITTVICQEADADDVPRKADKLPPSASAAYVILRQLSPDGKPVAEVALRDACMNGHNVSQSDVEKNRRDSFTRAMRDLLRRGLVSFKDGNYQMAITSPVDLADCPDDFPEKGEKQ